MATDMRIGLTIEAQADGAEKITKLERDLQDLGKSADAASPEFAALTKEVQELSRQAQAIQGFTQLKQASEQTRAQLAEMQQATRQAALAIKSLGQNQTEAQKAVESTRDKITLQLQVLAGARAQYESAKDASDGYKASILDSLNVLGQLRVRLDEQKKALQDIADNVQPDATEAVQEQALAQKQAKAAIDATTVEINRQKAHLADLRSQNAKAGSAVDGYKESVIGAQGELRRLEGELKTQERGLKNTTVELGRTQTEFDKLRVSTANTKKQFSEQSQELQRARDGLTAVGLSASNLAQSQAQVNKSTKAAEASFIALEQSTRKARDGVQSISTQLDTARQQLLGFLGIQLGAGAVKDVIGLADAYKNLQSRIGLVVGEGEHLARTMDDVQAVALRTHSALDSTGTLFARLAQAGKDAGLSLEQATEQSLALTESINQAVAISGAGAAASDAAITQLIQGLQSGVLRGEEFNSVMEQAPRLARALADGLGVTTGELRKMAESGALTTDVVIQSLQSQGQALEAEFGKLPLTVGRAITDVQTAFMRYVADTDAANGVTEKIAASISFVGENLESLADTLTIAGKGWLAFKAANMAQTWLDKAKAIAAAKLAVQEEATATTASTAATAANTGAKVANAAASKNQAAASGVKTAAIAAETAATVANTAATRAANAAKRAAANAAGLFGRGIAATGGAARGLVGLLGGPVGAIVTVAMFSGEIKKGITAVVEWGAGFTAAGRQMKASTAALAEMERQEKINAELRRQQAQEDAARAAKAQQAIAAQFDLSKAAQAATAEFAKLTKEGKTAAQAVADIAKGFDTTTQQGLRDFGTTLNKLAADGKLSADQLKAAWGQIIKTEDLQLFQLQAQQVFAGTAQGAQILAQITEATLTQALQRTGLSFGVLTGGMGDAARSAIHDVQTIAGSLESLAQQGVDTGTALTASIGKAIDTADSQKAIEAVRGQIEQLRSQLGDKITDGLLQQAEQKARDLKKAMDDATPGIQSVEEAMRKLGVTSSAALKESAEQSRAAYDVIRESGTASARDVREAFRIAAQAAIDAADGIAPAWVRAEAAQRGYVVQVNESGKSVIKLASEINNATAATGNLQGAWQGVGAAIEDAAEKAKRVKKESDDAAEAAETADRERRRMASVKIDRPRETYEQAKASGLSESQALAVMNEFWQNGNKVGWNSGRRGDTWGYLVVKKIDELVLANAQQRAAEGARGPAQPTTPATQQPPSGGGGATYVSNITLPSGKTAQVRFADEVSQSQAEEILRQLAAAKGAAA